MKMSYFDKLLKCENNSFQFVLNIEHLAGQMHSRHTPELAANCLSRTASRSNSSNEASVLNFEHKRTAAGITLNCSNSQTSSGFSSKASTSEREELPSFELADGAERNDNHKR